MTTAIIDIDYVHNIISLTETAFPLFSPFTVATGWLQRKAQHCACANSRETIARMQALAPGLAKGVDPANGHPCSRYCGTTRATPVQSSFWHHPGQPAPDDSSISSFLFVSRANTGVHLVLSTSFCTLIPRTSHEHSAATHIGCLHVRRYACVHHIPINFEILALGADTFGSKASSKL